MTFKESMKEDLDVLFNAEEMADIITINAVTCTAIIYSDKRNPSKRDQFGLYISKKTLLLKYEDWDILGKPGYDYELNIDNENFKIVEVDNQGSVIKINLEGVRS